MSPGQDMCEVQGTDLGDVSSLSLQHVATCGFSGQLRVESCHYCSGSYQAGTEQSGGLLGGGGNCELT